MSAIGLKLHGPTPGISIQDSGRFGYGRFGVPRSGAADHVALRLGNALLGNAPMEAAIEIRLQGVTVEAVGVSIRLGLAGAFESRLQPGDGSTPQRIGAWRSVRLAPGDQLRIGAPAAASLGYLTIAGGLALDPVLGSRSTYARAGLGCRLNAILPLRVHAPDADRPDRVLPTPPNVSRETLRVMAGPQDDHFDAAAMAAFLGQPYRAGVDIDRMGARLSGETPIRAKPAYGHDLVSDGLIPGAVQIPASGQPIILGADGQTVGGYPKIATVISADLHQIGRLTTGRTVRFAAVDRAGAQAALAALDAEIAAAEALIINHHDGLDLKALHCANLIGGVVDAAGGDHDPEQIPRSSTQRPLKRLWRRFAPLSNG